MGFLIFKVKISMVYAYLLLLSILPRPLAFAPMLRVHSTSLRSRQATWSSKSMTSNENESLDQKLFRIAHSLKLEIFDLEEEKYGLASKDQKYGLEVVRTPIVTEPSLGLELTEMASANDGRGLVLVSGVSGNCLETPIQVGDVVVGVLAGKKFKARTVGLDYDGTVEVLLDAKQAGLKEGSHTITLELERVVERAQIQVQVETGESEKPILVDCYAGENLRRLLLRRGIQLYDGRTSRFDMPFAKGDCAGEGLCGTCLVAVQAGQEILNPKDDLEKMITKGRPLSWRASCRTIVGADNQPGQLRIHTAPQSEFDDEINSGVKPLV